MKYFTDHPNLILVEADKTNEIIILTRDQYLEKLNGILSDTTKFCHLTKNPLQKDLKEYRKILNNMKPHLTKNQFKRLIPNQSL